jgi:hypothetical protein
MFHFSRFTGLSAALLMTTALGLSAQEATHSAPMIERYGKPYVMVTIDGKGPYRFVIDTGTGADAFVTPELADELKLPTIGEVRVNDPSRPPWFSCHPSNSPG